jgi:hypothetical protein
MTRSVITRPVSGRLRAWHHAGVVARFEDLTPYRYRAGQGALNVGWLGSGHPYPAGPVDGVVICSVLRVVRDRPVNRTRGWHPVRAPLRPGRAGSRRPGADGAGWGACPAR